MPPLDFTGQGNSFQLPPELAQFAMQGGAAPMVQGLMQARGGAPAMPAPHPHPAPGPVVPAQPVVAQPMGAGQNALLDAGAAMLENSGTPFGRSIGAGLAAGKAAYTATKNADAERTYQQNMLDAVSRGWDEAERRGVVPAGTGASAKTLPLAQQQKMLGEFLQPKPEVVAEGGSVWDVQKGKWVTPNPKPTPDKPDFTLKGPNGEETRYNGNTGATMTVGPKGPKPVSVSSEFRSAISMVSGGKTDDPTQLNTVLGLKPDDRTAMDKAWKAYVQIRTAPAVAGAGASAANAPGGPIVKGADGNYHRVDRQGNQSADVVDANGTPIAVPKKGGFLDEIMSGGAGQTPPAGGPTAGTIAKNPKAESGYVVFDGTKWGPVPKGDPRIPK